MPPSPSFRLRNNEYIESHKAGWKNQKHAEQWTSTLKTYCEPVIGSLPVDQIDTGLILQILEPIWAAKPETASRLRGRIKNILDAAKAKGYRSGENPAAPGGGILKRLLPALATKSPRSFITQGNAIRRHCGFSDSASQRN